MPIEIHREAIHPIPHTQVRYVQDNDPEAIELLRQAAEQENEKRLSESSTEPDSEDK